MMIHKSNIEHNRTIQIHRIVADWNKFIMNVALANRMCRILSKKKGGFSSADVNKLSWINNILQFL